MDVARDEDPAGDREERKEQDDEGQVFDKDGPSHGMHRQPRREREGEWHERQRAPDERELAVVMFPQMRIEERPRRDRQQNADERQYPEKGHRGPGETGAVGSKRRARTEAKDERCGRKRRDQISPMHGSVLPSRMLL